jgi:hypothetical protein
LEGIELDEVWNKVIEVSRLNKCGLMFKTIFKIALVGVLAYLFVVPT